MPLSRNQHQITSCHFGLFRLSISSFSHYVGCYNKAHKNRNQDKKVPSSLTVPFGNIANNVAERNANNLNQSY